MVLSYRNQSVDLKKDGCGYTGDNIIHRMQTNPFSYDIIGWPAKLGITIPGEFLVFRQKPQVFPGTNANFPGVL